MLEINLERYFYYLKFGGLRPRPYASAPRNAGIGRASSRCRLDAETEAQLAAYIAEIKDAGVRTALVNIDPDRFNCEADVYYDPMLVAETVESACREAVRNYIENLPFNGEYTNMALVDALQTLDGVRIVEFRGATTVAARRCWLRSTRGASRPRAISRWATSYSI